MSNNKNTMLIKNIPDYAKDFKNEYLFIIGINNEFLNSLLIKRLEERRLSCLFRLISDTKTAGSQGYGPNASVYVFRLSFIIDLCLSLLSTHYQHAHSSLGTLASWFIVKLSVSFLRLVQ